MAWAKLAFGEFVNIRAGSNFAAFAGNLAGRGAYRLEIIWRRSSIPLWFGCLGVDLEPLRKTGQLKKIVTTRLLAIRSCYRGVPELSVSADGGLS